VKFKAISSGPRRGEFVTRRLNGGVNYSFTYGLTASELIDCADVDLSESGAIGSRRAFIPFTTCELDQPVVAAWTWQDKMGNDYMFVVMEDLEIRQRRGGEECFGETVFGTISDEDSRCLPHAWSAGGWLYVSDGFRVIRWGGEGFPTTDDVTSVFVHPMNITPEVTNLGVPPNCAATTYRDTVFIANTLVYMTDPDAVWWSAPVAEQPDGAPLEGLLTGQEDFYENQRITFITGNQADRISKLVSAGPTLYAFKRHSVHVLSTNGSTVLTNDLTTNLGLAGPKAVTVHNNSVWFFDEHEGLHVIAGNSLPEKVFDPIFPLLDCGRISNAETVAVGFDGTKVFVSCCLDSDVPVNNTTFVLHTNLSSTSKGGAWTRWDVGFSEFARWEPQANDSSLVGFTTGAGGRPLGAVRLNECTNAIVDDYGFTTEEYAPWFKTAFFDDGLPNLTKQWKRVALTVVGTDRTTMTMKATTGPKPRSTPSCEQPGYLQPLIPGGQTGLIDLDLTPYECDPPESVLLCDTDSKGETYQNGPVFCGDVVGVGPVAARAVRVATPGRGVSFSIEVHDVGSEAAWTVEELDVKYAAITERS